MEFLEDKSVVGEHDSVAHWTVGAGHGFPFRTVCCVRDLMALLPCLRGTVEMGFEGPALDHQKHRGTGRGGAHSACRCAVQVVAFCGRPALGMLAGTALLVFLPLAAATLQCWPESCVDTVVLASKHFCQCRLCCAQD